MFHNIKLLKKSKKHNTDIFVPILSRAIFEKRGKNFRQKIERKKKKKGGAKRNFWIQSSEAYCYAKVKYDKVKYETKRAHNECVLIEKQEEGVMKCRERDN